MTRDRAPRYPGLVAGALVLISGFLPIWESRLEAPQYPDGLRLSVYGNRIEGDLAEIDSLNHYIGMSPIRIDDLPEVRLWPLAVGLALVAVLVSAVAGRRLIVRAARLYVWLLPLGVLATVQLRLYQYGHDLDPGAALRVGNFTPLVMGPTRVWNFTAWSRPGTAVVALWLAASLITFGPGLARKVSLRSKPAMVAATLSVMMAGMALPAHAHAGHPAGAEGTDLADLLAGVPDGGTLVLQPGVYQGDVVIDRPVRVEGRGMPEIVGSGTRTVLTVTAPGTAISGVRIRGSGPGPTAHPAGIRIEADDVEVERVVVEDTYTGIAVMEASRVRLVGNTIVGRSELSITSEGHAVGDDENHQEFGSRGDGISLWHAQGVLVRENSIVGVRDGVYLSFGSGALLDRNVISDSRYAVHSMYAADLALAENRMEGNLSGAVLMYGGPALLLRNHVEANSSPSTGFGVLLKDVVDAELVENVIIFNRVGLHLDGPTGEDETTFLTANTLARNQIGVVVYSSANAVFQANSFADNVVQVLQQSRGAGGKLKWSHKGVGNYWSNYRGFDVGGRGAIPHLEGSAVDRVLVQAPVLMPLASGPALRLLRAVEDRWTERRPVLVDELPLTRPMSVRLPDEPSQARAGVVAAGVGLTMAGLSGAVLVMMGLGPERRRRRAVG